MKAKEITPKKMRCAVGPCPSLFKIAGRGVGACPTIYKTSRPLNCVSGLGCPSTFKSGETLLIIGKVSQVSMLPKNVLKKIGPGEMAVEIPASLLITKKNK